MEQFQSFIIIFNSIQCILKQTNFEDIVFMKCTRFSILILNIYNMGISIYEDIIYSKLSLRI